MAFRGTCGICKGTTYKTGDHPECINAVALDLLAQIQGHLKNNPDKALPPEIREKVLAQKVDRIEVFSQKKLTKFCQEQRISKDAFAVFEKPKRRAPSSGEKPFTESYDITEFG